MNESTVYVERLPLKASESNVRDFFKAYGESRKCTFQKMTVAGSLAETDT